MKSPIDEMVDRFLSWPLPEDFQPDAGISFKADYNEHTAYPAKHKPIGTNLFSADQAKAMLEFVISDAIESLQAENDALREALEIAKAAIWDSHYGNGITAGYAQSVSAHIDAAIKKATD